MNEGKTLVTEGKTLVTEGKTLVTEGMNLVTEGKTLKTIRKTLVTEGKTFVTDGKTLETCNDAQSLLIREMYAAICHTIAHLLFCLNHSVVLNVSPIWAGSFRTQGQG